MLGDKGNRRSFVLSIMFGATCYITKLKVQGKTIWPWLYVYKCKSHSGYQCRVDFMTNALRYLICWSNTGVNRLQVFKSRTPFEIIHLELSLRFTRLYEI